MENLREKKERSLVVGLIALIVIIVVLALIGLFLLKPEPQIIVYFLIYYKIVQVGF